MFAGVGPFSISIARRRKNVKVYAADINPDAIAYLKRNIALNQVGDRVFPLEGDVKKVVKIVAEKVDRVIMNLPENSLEYLETACEALKPDSGIIHFYGFAEEPNPGDRVLESLIAQLNRISWKISEVRHKRLVKPAAPRIWLVAVDCKVSQTESKPLTL
jgi:tRNA (guanine37-N1)-methyltransferase